MKKTLIIFATTIIFSNIGYTEQTKFNHKEICTATIAIVMGKDPSIIKIDDLKNDTVFLSYIRKSDNKHWAYRCKLEGPHVIWSSANGRWRTHALDSKITYKIHDNNLEITEIYSDKSKTIKSFTTNQLKN